MPLDIETNISKVKTVVITSETIELISITNILADSKHHQFASEWIEKVREELSEGSIELLKMISKLPYQGLEFFEIILACRCFDDISSFISIIEQYQNNYFIHILTGELLAENEVESFKKDNTKLHAFLDKMPWAIRENYDIFEFIVNDTENFKQALCNLFREVHNQIVRDKLKELNSEYKLSIKELQDKLNSKDPLEVAEELMTKRLEKKHNINEYIFVPSYFINPHYLLAFDNKSWLIVYDMRLSERALKMAEGEYLSTALKVIGDKSRLELLRLLILQPSYGKLLANRLKLTTATISHHLEQLQSIGLINEARNKNIKHFSADVEEIEKLLDNLKSFLFNK